MSAKRRAFSARSCRQLDSMKKTQQVDIWYREPYVWFLIAVPLAAVIGGIITAELAIESNDGLVVDDYYKQGLEINRVIERDDAAAKLGIQADIQLSREQHTFRLFLTGNARFTAPGKVNVSFLHATRSGFDEHLSIPRKDKNLYQAQLPQLEKGRWYIQIETGDWRVLKTILIR